MQFSNIIGQQEIKQQLVELVQHNRLSHALLFLGKEGNGSLALALALSQYLVCENTKPKSQIANDSCGKCAACTKAQQLVHPDIHFSYPVVTKKSGTPPISTDYISEWREFIKTYPYGNVYDWLQLIGAENKQGNITELGESIGV